MEAMGTFHDRPAVVFAARAVARLKIDLLPSSLTDIRDVQITSQTVKGETPRVA